MEKQMELVYRENYQSIAKIISQELPGIQLGCRPSHDRLFPNKKYLEFFLLDENRFRFWFHIEESAMNNPKSLHIIPFYHPVMQGWKKFGLVNGDTDSLIGKSKQGIDRLYCPPEAMGIQKGFGSWSHVNHPFYAEGKSFIVEINEKILSIDGMKSLMELLFAALNINNSYVPISGGFHSSYDHPGNFSENARGSEDHCVWAYQTLGKEDKLKEAFVPEWFYNEKWLERYSFV